MCPFETLLDIWCMMRLQHRLTTWLKFQKLMGRKKLSLPLTHPSLSQSFKLLFVPYRRPTSTTLRMRNILKSRKLAKMAQKVDIVKYNCIILVVFQTTHIRQSMKKTIGLRFFFFLLYLNLYIRSKIICNLFLCLPAAHMLGR